MAAADLRSINPGRRRPPTDPSLYPSDKEITLPLVDCLQFPRQTRGAPWLFTVSCDGKMLYGIDCLGDTGDPMVFRAPLPRQLHGWELFSSVGPFLLLEKRGSPSGIRLFNPFSSSSSQLPSLPPSATLLPRSRRFSPPVEIRTVAGDASCGIALALLRSPPSVAYASVAYARLDCSGAVRGWIDISHLTSTYFSTALLYKPALFCAVDTSGTKVVAFDFSGPPTPRLADMTFNLPDNCSLRPEPDDFCCYQSASLLCSGSSLFLVRWRNTLNPDGVSLGREIDVFMLHDDDEQWVPVNSLGDLSFFIGRNQSVSMSALDFPGLKSNRVYLPLDPLFPIAGNRYTCPHPYDADGQHLCRHLLYNLEDESWGVFLYDGFRVPHDYLSPDVWMIPLPL